MKRIAFILITIFIHSYVQECLAQYKYTVNVVDAETQTRTTNLLLHHLTSKMKFRSNEDGIIEVKKFPNGINKFVVKSPLYYPDTLALRFPISRDSSLPFIVKKVDLDSLLFDTLKNSVVIQVLDKETNEPLPGTIIYFKDTDTSTWTFTDRYGIGILGIIPESTENDLNIFIIPDYEYYRDTVYFNRVEKRDSILTVYLSMKPIDESEIDYMPYVYKTSAKPDTTFFQNQFYCQLLDNFDRPLPDIYIGIKELKITDHTNSKGEFKLELIPNGKYRLFIGQYPWEYVEVPLMLNNGKAWVVGERMFYRIFEMTSKYLTLDYTEFKVKIQAFY